MTKRRVVSYSELSTYQQCPLKHWFGYHQTWEAPTKSDALERGSAWHQVMDVHYRALQQFQQRLGGRRLDPNTNEVARALNRCRARVKPLLVDPDTGQQTEQQQLLEWMYEGYLEWYGVDQDWLILDIENTEEVAVPHPDGGESEFILKMKIDLLVKDEDGRQWVVDHKTASNIPNVRAYDLDDQFGFYTWGMRQLGRPVFGSIHSAALTRKNKKAPQPLDTRFKRTNMFRTDIELSNIALDVYRTARAAMRDELPYSSPNPDQCNWKCEFRDVHLDVRKGYSVEHAMTGRGFTRSGYDRTR